MKPLYTVAEGNGEFPMGQLGYDPGKDDLIVAAVHSELNMYTSDEGVALRIWGWDPKALRNEERYHIEQLIRMFLYQEERIRRALERLDAQLGALRSSSAEARERVQEYTDALVEAARKRPQRGMRRDSRDEWDRFDSAIDFYDPEVARPLESHSLGKAGRSFTGEMWRFGDKGYGPDRIPDDELRELIDTVLAVEAEYQLQSLLLDREFTRIITTRGQEFEYLKALAAERAAAEEGDGGWGILGDVLGVVSAVSGVLALIPVLTPICGPIAVVTAVGVLGAHTVGAVVEGDWDAGTIAGLVTDVVGAVPAFGAVAKGLRTGTVSMRSVGKVGVAVRSGGRAFLAATGGAAAAEAGAIARYLGAKGAQIVGATKQGGVVAGKVIQGSVSMATQIPTVVALSTGVESGTADSVATGTDLTIGTLEMVGDWKVFGNISKRAGTVSIAAFSKVFA